MKRNTVSKLTGLLFVLPWIVGFLFFTLYPFMETVKYAFNTVRFLPVGIAMDYVGLDNFVSVLFKDPDFLLQLPVFLMQMACLVPMVLVFSIMLAVLLNAKIKMRRVFRAIFFLPVIIISGSVLENLQINDAVSLSGMRTFFIYVFIQEYLPGFLSRVILYIFDNVVILLWFSGVQILIFLSGLQKVDRAIYDAADVDGASGWQKFWKITIPTLKPFLFLNAMYTIVDIANSSINPIIGFIRQAMFQLLRGFGFAASLTWLYFGLIVVVVLIYYLLLGRGEKETKINRKRRRKKDKVRRGFLRPALISSGSLAKNAKGGTAV
ncbi:MAG: sugar ABC transporter permease [Clostridiales bacterium]|jgi:ABC-type sugar transport system permease subunit|nr:sugar ABC transporter permease [Clostridiales bacterium]